MHYSWSQMQSYAKCGRAHEMGYIEGYEKTPSAGNRARYYGSAFHAGMAAALVMSRKDVPVEELLKTAVGAARKALDDMTIQNKIVTGTDGKSYDDKDYYDMMHEIGQAIPTILRYYIPMIDFARYYVPMVHEVITVSPQTLPCKHCNGSGWSVPPITSGEDATECTVCDGTGINRAAAEQPMVEFYFQYGKFSGIIDAVLYDRNTGQFVLVDWKLRKSFPMDELAAIDGQLGFYAACLEKMGATISETIMWQFKLQTPKPANINKNGLPSIAAQDTTWEYWVETLPSPTLKLIKLDEWKVTMADKLKSVEDYSRPVRTPVSDFMLLAAYDNALEIVHMIEVSQARYLEGRPAMAVLGSNACSFCDFKLLCASVFKHGGDAAALLDLHYQKRSHEYEVSEEI